MGSGSICVRIVCQIRGDRRLPKGAVLTCGRSAALYSMNLNTRALMSQECASCVPLLRAKEETLWLAKLAKSLHEATADGSFGSIWAAITKPRSATTTTERSTAV